MPCSWDTLYFAYWELPLSSVCAALLAADVACDIHGNLLYHMVRLYKVIPLCRGQLVLGKLHMSGPSILTQAMNYAQGSQNRKKPL